MFAHEVVAVVLQVREARLHVMLWRRALDPYRGHWALPGGRLEPSDSLDNAIRRHLATKVDLASIGHLEQLDTRVRADAAVATAYLGSVATDATPGFPDDTTWHSVDNLPSAAFDHADLVDTAVARLRAKLSYTNVAFALAPPTFTIGELRGVYQAALGHDVDPSNLRRVLERRNAIVPTGQISRPGPGGGRPGSLYRFAKRSLVVTDAFATFRPR